jgi:hypothetical protein
LQVDADLEIATVLAAMDDAASASGTADLETVVRLCVVSGMSNWHAYYVIRRYNNLAWRKIGTNLAFIKKT